MVTKTFYSYEDMGKDLATIQRALHLDGVVPDVVYGITRGGLIPAVHMSHYFDAPMETIKVTTYDDTHYGDVSPIIERLMRGESVLLVDDICDTGNTLRYIIDEVQKNDDAEGDSEPMLDRLYIATLIHNEASDVEPDYAATVINKVENPCWIVFPWEQA